MGITVVIDDVLEALELASDEITSYVSARTGEVITLTDEDLRLAEEDPDPAMPARQQETVARARQMFESNEWLELPGKFDIHEWAIMERFADAQPEEPVRTELHDAIRGRGAFRSFKSVIRRLGVEREWFAYKQRALEELAREWLASHDLVPVARADPHGVS